MTVRGLIVLAVVLASSRAVAEPGVWNGFRALGVVDAQVEALDQVTGNALRGGGLVDELERAAAAGKCGSDVYCHCAVTREHQARYGAFGTIGHLGDLWTIELTLVDAHTCTVVATAFASESLADDRVPSKLAELAVRLTTPPAAIAETATAGGVRPIDATPSIVTTFTRRELRALQIRTLDDLLPLVPGFDVVDANWGGLILDQGLPNTLLFAANGIPLINGLNNFRWLGRDFRTSLAHIDRIEIVRGPGAALWGQNAFLGVVNLIAETPTRRDPSVEAGVTIGSLDTEEVWARGGQNRGGYAFTASIDAGRRVGPTTQVPDSPQAIVSVPPPIPFGNGGVTHPDPDVWFDTMLRFALRREVAFTFENLTSDYHFEISPLGALLDAGHGGWWRKTQRLYGVELHEPVSRTIGVHAQLSRYEYFSQENFAIQPAWPDGPIPNPMQRDLRPGLRSLQGNDTPRTANQLDLRIAHDRDGAIKNRLIAGVTALHMHTPGSFATLIGIDDEPASPVLSFGERTFWTLSSYAYDELAPMPWLVVSAAARLQIDHRDTHGAGSDTGWSPTPSFQGGAAVVDGGRGGKLFYAEGFRPPDAVSLYSQVGTKGNPDLSAERSRELAAEVHDEVVDGLTLRLGGNLTRLSNLIELVPIVGDPNFAYTPANKGTIDVASVFVEARLAALADLDGFASYHATWLDESDPVGFGIPLARHSAALGLVWRPLTAVSVFLRGTVASSRHLHVLTAAGPIAYTTVPTVRSATGVAIANVMPGVDFELMIDNPLLLEHEAPYQVDGSTTGLVERRRGTEVFAGLHLER